MRWSTALALVGTASILCPPAQASSLDDLPLIAAAIDAGRLVQAEVMLARLREPADPDGAEAVAGIRGRFALAAGAPEHALTIFDALHAAKPAQCDYARDLGIAATRTGDARAMGLLSDTIARCATWQSGQMLGVVLAQARRWQESENAFALSLRLSPGNAVTLNNRAFARIEQARYIEALGDLRAASRATPGDRRIANNIDLVEGALGHAPQRHQGADDDGAWASRLTLAAKGALRAGRTDLARAMLAEAVDIAPYHASEPSALLAGLAGTGRGVK